MIETNCFLLIVFVLSVHAGNQPVNIFWPFDLNTNDLNDAYNGIPINNPTYVPSPVSSTAIHLRSSLKQAIFVPRPLLISSGSSFTIDCWIHPMTLSSFDNSILALCPHPSASVCLHFGVRNATLYAYYHGEIVRSNATLKVSNWYHVALVLDAPSLKLSLYLNGKQDVMKRVPKSPDINMNITIGTSAISFTHHTHFDGYLDQLSFVSFPKDAEKLLLDATSTYSHGIKDPSRNPYITYDAIPFENCHRQIEIIHQQSKVIEKQITMTQSVLQMSMETVASMWNKQQNQRISEEYILPGPKTPIRSANISPESKIPDFTPPNRVWCPWKADCTQILDQRGQATVEMDQDKVLLPFELYLSMSDDPLNDTYVIYFSVDEHEVSIYKTVRGVTNVIHRKTEDDFTLKSGTGRYWLSIDYANSFVKYGQGEVRDRCTLLKSDVPESENDYLRRIQYAHVSFNKSRDVTELKKYETQVKLKVGRNPVVDDPALIVVSPDKFTLDGYENNTELSVLRLNTHCQALYYDVVYWQFQDEKFPYLYEAIEQSINSATGWCYKTLQAKANRFGKPNIRATYLRITVGRNRGTSPGVPYVLEIWPPGHYSPIHAHGNTYGIIKVLYGEINVKIYRNLSLKKKKHIHETNFTEGHVTWLSPGLNQVHKLENLSAEKSCITIQAYEYYSGEVNNYEFFDYITNDGQEIKKFDPVSDMDYYKFKMLMIDEWNNRRQIG